MKDDATLLHGYAYQRSEADFAELVRRHVDFVYSVALRELNGDAHLAQDATQLVFIDVARKAARLAGHRLLAGWLFNSTRYAAANLVRSARRRQLREQAAQPMQTINASEPVDALDWEQVRPVLDEALGELNERDREALLLRFLQNRDYSAIGVQLAVSEDAARMCVNRALDKLRAVLGRRGVTSTSAALMAVLTTQATVAAPAGLAMTITGTALAGAGAGAGVLSIMGLTKLQLGVASAVLLAGVGAALFQNQERQNLQRELAATPAVLTSDNARLKQSIHELAAAAQAAEALQVDEAELARLSDEALRLHAEVENTAREARGRSAWIAPRPIQLYKVPTWF